MGSSVYIPIRSVVLVLLMAFCLILMMVGTRQWPMTPRLMYVLLGMLLVAAILDR